MPARGSTWKSWERHSGVLNSAMAGPSPTARQLSTQERMAPLLGAGGDLNT